MDFKKLAQQYKSELLDNVLPFWLEKSQDLAIYVVDSWMDTVEKYLFPLQVAE